MKNGKRILTVKIRHLFDESPDTSYLGEYSSHAETEYAIDRRHQLECRVNNPLTDEAVTILQHAYDHLESSDDPNTDALSTLQSLFENECDCGGHYWDRHTFQFFNGPVENYKGESPEDIRKYVRQDYERMESLNNQNWYYMGVRVDAEVVSTDRVVQRITSGGLWGVESDAGDDHIKSIEQEEMDSLKSELAALGFSKRAVSKAIKEATVVNE